MAYYETMDTRRNRRNFTEYEALLIGEAIGIDWKTSKFDIKQFRMGLDVELEHGLKYPKTNITFNNPIMTGKIALVHLNELNDYYYRLKKMEQG
jgi:hypothetical protein